MPEIKTIQARAVEKVLAAAAKAGVKRRHLLVAARISDQLLKNPEARIPYAEYVALYEHAARLTGDDAFGLHLGEGVSLQMYDVIGYATMNTPTLGEGVNKWIRFYRRMSVCWMSVI